MFTTFCFFFKKKTLKFDFWALLRFFWNWNWSGLTWNGTWIGTELEKGTGTGSDRSKKVELIMPCLNPASNVFVFGPTLGFAFFFFLGRAFSPPPPSPVSPDWPPPGLAPIPIGRRYLLRQSKMQPPPSSQERGGGTRNGAHAAELDARSRISLLPPSVHSLLVCGPPFPFPTFLCHCCCWSRWRS